MFLIIICDLRQKSCTGILLLIWYRMLSLEEALAQLHSSSWQQNRWITLEAAGKPEVGDEGRRKKWVCIFSSGKVSSQSDISPSGFLDTSPAKAGPISSAPLLCCLSLQLQCYSFPSSYPTLTARLKLVFNTNEAAWNWKWTWTVLLLPLPVHCSIIGHKWLVFCFFPSGLVWGQGDSGPSLTLGENRYLYLHSISLSQGPWGSGAFPLSKC